MKYALLIIILVFHQDQFDSWWDWLALASVIAGSVFLESFFKALGDDIRKERQIWRNINRNISTGSRRADGD